MEGVPIQVQPMDQAIRSENCVNRSRASSVKWDFCGRDIPRSEIVFFVQVIIVYIVVLVSIVNLSIGRQGDKLWIALLSSSIGYLLPNPSLKKNE